MGLLSQNQSQYYNSSNSANYGDNQFTSLENIELSRRGIYKKSIVFPTVSDDDQYDI